MKRIITIQHTQSVHHTNGMVGSWTDWDLSELGKEQAENIGKNLFSEFGREKFIMYSSDLLRARHTAEIVATHLNVELIICGALRERNLGSAVGKSVQWLRENMECQESTVDDKMFHDAESRRDVWNRLQPFLNKILNDENENTIIVSHGDTLSVFNALWLGFEPEKLNKYDLFGMSGGVTLLQENAESKHVIRKLSDMSYMKL